MKVSISIPFVGEIARWVRKTKGGTWYLCRHVTTEYAPTSEVVVDICRWRRKCGPHEHVVKMEQYG